MPRELEGLATDHLQLTKAALSAQGSNPFDELPKVDSAAKVAQKQPNPNSPSKIQKPKSKEKEYALPIKLWVFGAQRFESFISDSQETQFWLCVCGDEISILKYHASKKTAIFSYKLGHDIGSIEMPQNHTVAQEFPLIVFTLRENATTASFIAQNKAAKSNNPTVAVKLLVTHMAWKVSLYNEVETILKSGEVAVYFLNALSLRSRWGTITDVVNDANPGIKSPQTPRRRPKPRPSYSGTKTIMTETSGSLSKRNIPSPVSPSPRGMSSRELTMVNHQSSSHEKSLVGTTPTSQGELPNSESHPSPNAASRKDRGVVRKSKLAVESAALDVFRDEPETSENLSHLYKQIDEAVHQAINILSS